MEFYVSVLLRPEAERHGSEFVDQRISEAILSKVNGFYIGLADVAAFDADVRECFGGVDRKFGMVFLAASWADDAAELPFGEADPAEQATAASVALLAKHAERRLPIAEWT
jgi:hypothetical protein